MRTADPAEIRSVPSDGEPRKHRVGRGCQKVVSMRRAGSTRTVALEPHHAVHDVEGQPQTDTRQQVVASPSSSTPNPACWPFETAIQCGGSLAAYRQTAIEAARRTFPSLFIAACGGFHRREEAFSACEYANVIVENEAYTRYGPGIALQLLHKLVLRLRFLQRAGQIDTRSLSRRPRRAMSFCS